MEKQIETQIETLRKELGRAEADSDRLCAMRAAAPPGSSRARVTTLNARWARVTEYRDLLRKKLEELTAEQRCHAAGGLKC